MESNWSQPSLGATQVNVMYSGDTKSACPRFTQQSLGHSKKFYGLEIHWHS